MVEEDRKGERGWEALKLYFEFFKHFTTLSSVLAVVVIALGLGSGATVTILVLLGINLLLSLVGMYVVMFRANNWRDAHAPGVLPFALMVSTIIAFIIGLFTALLLSAGLDTNVCLFPIFGLC